MTWVHFIYENGSNPYIAITEKEVKRMFRKYRGRLKKIGENTYYIFD